MDQAVQSLDKFNFSNQNENDNPLTLSRDAPRRVRPSGLFPVTELMMITCCEADAPRRVPTKLLY